MKKAILWIDKELKIFKKDFIFYNYQKRKQKMSSVSKSKRNSRKAKTSILYQIKNHVQQNVQVSQSINIVSLKNPYSNQKQKLEKIEEQPNAQSAKKIKTNESLNKNIRRTHQSGKLVITLKDQITQGDNLLQKKQCRSSHSFSPKVYDINQTIEKMIRSRLVLLDKQRIFSDLKTFKGIISDYLSRIDILETENIQLLAKNRKYEIFLKEMNFKQGIQGEENSEKNSQLKILNLERKVQTLNYIIKQYRTNNKEEIKVFEKKINDYKPTLEVELTKMLSDANQKNKELQNLVKFFQAEFIKYNDSIDWVSFVKSLKDKQEQVSVLKQKIEGTQKQMQEIKSKYNEDKKIIDDLQRINSQNMQLKWRVDEEEKLKFQANRECLQKQQKYYEVYRNYQELSYKYEALRKLQTKIVHKDEAIRRNTLVINRLQNDNYCLKAKIETFKNNEEKQIFSHDQEIQEKLEKRNHSVEELTKRLFQEVDQIPEQYRQTTSFIGHLFGKVKDTFENMINEYRQQLLAKVVELKDEKSTVESLLDQNRKRNELCQQIFQDLQQIDAKRNRCVESQQKLGQTDSCGSCMSWMLHWGQINNLFGQIRTQIDKLTKLI